MTGRSYTTWTLTIGEVPSRRRPARSTPVADGSSARAGRSEPRAAAPLAPTDRATPASRRGSGRPGLDDQARAERVGARRTRPVGGPTARDGRTGPRWVPAGTAPVARTVSASAS